MKRILLAGLVALPLPAIEVTYPKESPIPEHRCKTIQVQMDCNTCEFERCTDGVKQWDEKTMKCTVMGCVKDGPYNPDDWDTDSKEVERDSAVNVTEEDI